MENETKLKQANRIVGYLASTNTMESDIERNRANPDR